MASLLGKRVRNLEAYELRDDGCISDDVIHVGATGTVTDDDVNNPSVKWDHLPDSPNWCQWHEYLEVIEG